MERHRVDPPRRSVFPFPGKELLLRTYREVLADDCFGLAAQLAYYFFLALVPALLFLVALISFIELNAEIEHASPYGKDPGEREVGEKREDRRARRTRAGAG